jgi:hypothetical protein
MSIWVMACSCPGLSDVDARDAGRARRTRLRPAGRLPRLPQHPLAQHSQPAPVSHYRTALGTAPVGTRWPGLVLGTAARDIRTDRILDEVRATGGDGRRVCDLFGLSVKAAHRYSGSTRAGQRAAVTCDRDGT